MTSARRTGNRRRERTVEALRHEEDTRTNIPTAEYQSMVREEQEAPLQKAYERRNRDLDPQLVWRGKDEQDLVRPGGQRAAPVHPGEGASQGAHRRPDASDPGRPARMRVCSLTCSPISTACLRARTAPTSTSTTATGPTA